MSKKLLSAVLAIAMMLSMCTAFITSAASDNTYADDYAALQAAIKELFVKGPSISNSAIKFLLDVKAIDGQDLLDRNEVFEVYYAYEDLEFDNTDKADGANAAYFVKDATVVPAVYDAYAQYAYNYDAAAADITDVAEGLLIYAASVYYFGQQPDSLKGLTDIAQFNAKRNELVKEATALVEGFIDFMKAEAGIDSNKPAAYAAAFNAWKQNYIAKYNINYGVNPFDGLDDVLFNEWWTILVGSNLVDSVTFPGWYTVEELRADPAVAPYLAAFEKAYKAAQAANGAGVLYYDFVTATTSELDNAWENLVAAILADFNMETPAGVSAVDAIKAFNTLVEVLDVYNTYVADSYQNIYTAADKALISNVLFAEMIVEWVSYSANPVTLLYLVGADYFVEITDGIIAGIAALDYSISNRLLSDADINEGVALINQAQVLLLTWEFWGEKDLETDERTAYDALAAAVALLKGMLPYAAGDKIEYVIEADSTSIVVYDLDGTKIANKNNEATVVFEPNFYAFVRLYDTLVAVMNEFNAAVAAWDGKTAILDPVEIKNEYNKKSLITFLTTYDFIVGYEVVDNGDGTVCYSGSAVLDSAKYQQILAAIIYPAVVGGNEPARSQGHIIGGKSGWLDHDQVKENQAYGELVEFINQFEQAMLICNGQMDWNDPVSVYRYDWHIDSINQNKNKFRIQGNSWSWQSGTLSGMNNGYAAIATQLATKLSNVTVDFVELLNVYEYITTAIFAHWQGASNSGVYTSNPDDWKFGANPIWYGGGWWDAGFFYRAGTWCVNDSYAGFCNDGSVYDKWWYSHNHWQEKVTNQGNRPTITVMQAYYDEVLTCTYDMLTERGEALLNAWIADVITWVDVQTINGAKDAPWTLFETLCDTFGDPRTGSVKNWPLPKQENQLYLYYDLTLAMVVGNEFADPSNIYSGKETFIEMFYNPMLEASQAFDYVDVSGYDTEWAEEFAAAREQIGYFLMNIDLNAAVNVGGGHKAARNMIKTDITLSATIELLETIEDLIETKEDHSVAALELYKATELDPVLAEAYGKNINDYVTDNAAAKKVWTAYTEAYADALTVRNTARAPKSEIDAAVTALATAIDALAEIAKETPAATVDGLKAKIAEAEALLNRIGGNDALAAAIEEAQDLAAELRYNVTYFEADIDAAVAALDEAMAAAADEAFLADDLAAYLAEVAEEVTANAENYPADAYNAFVAAYNEAKAIAETTTDEAAYVAAKELVAAAYEALVNPGMSKIAEAAANILAELKAVDTADCSAASVAAFEAAIADLEAGLEAGADDDAVLELITKAYLAKEALVVNNAETLDD